MTITFDPEGQGNIQCPMVDYVKSISDNQYFVTYHNLSALNYDLDL